MSTKMKAAQISKPGGDWELIERDVPEPHPGHVRVKVEACGICHSDALVKEGLWPGLLYPRVPGHEVAGRIDALGNGVTTWKKGQRVGVGWHGGHDFVCDECRRGDFGMCASVTVFNALRNSGALSGDVVAVQGIGGLGHLGVQYARRMGFETVALGRGKDKEPLAKELGAHHYIDSSAVDTVSELQKLGGARLILATAPSAKAISSVVEGLGVNGNLLVPAAPNDPLTISLMPLIMGRRAVSGWYSGTARDSQDTLEFSALSGVHPMIEKYPLSRVAEAYEQMHSGKVRFRVVLTMGV